MIRAANDDERVWRKVNRLGIHIRRWTAHDRHIDLIGFEQSGHFFAIVDQQAHSHVRVNFAERG